jgi:hypothetical protein
MNAKRISSLIVALALMTCAPLLPRAQTDDVFAFIPAGGRTLLEKMIASKPTSGDMAFILNGKREYDGWVAYLQSRSSAIPAIKDLSEQEVKTLADYLAMNMPLSAGSDAPKDLSRDGRDLVLEYCQSCHIITVVVTQDRSKEAWLGTMNKPSHVEIKTTAHEREALANYLVLNAGIPIEQIPEELRAGGASY